MKTKGAKGKADGVKGKKKKAQKAASPPAERSEEEKQEEEEELSSGWEEVTNDEAEEIEVYACDFCNSTFSFFHEAAACERVCKKAKGAAQPKEKEKEQREKAKAALGPVDQVFIAGVPWSAAKEEIKSVCQDKGKIVDMTNPCKRAFVVFKSSDDARKAVKELDGTSFNGGTLKLLLKDPLPPGVKKRRNKSRRPEERAKAKGRGKGKGRGGRGYPRG